MLEWTWRRTIAAGCFARVVVATDDERIERAARGFGARVVRTRGDHPSGTDRVAEVADAADPAPDAVVNVQADEPLVPLDGLRTLTAAMEARPDAIWTLATPLVDPVDLARASVVKVALAADGRALYFSRAPIPFVRDPGSAHGVTHHRHLGVYGYPVSLLRRFVAAPPSRLERLEALEQLRALELGIEIRVVLAASDSPGIDTPEDLERLRSGYPSADAFEHALG